MPVVLNSIYFRDEFRPERTNFLIGAIGDKKVAELDVTASWGHSSTIEDRTVFSGTYIWFVDDDGDLTGVTWASLGFFVGDFFVVSNSASNTGTFQIMSISADGLTINVGVALTTLVSDTAIITGTTQVTGIDYRYNLRENAASNNFNSLVDQNELRFSKGGLSYSSFASFTALQQGVYNSNHQGSVIIRGYGRQYSASVGNPFVFAAAGSTLTWALGDFVNEGIKVGDSITFTGTVSNNVTRVVTVVTTTVLTFSAAIVNESSNAGVATRAAILNRFTIYHTFYITPLFLVDDLTDFLQDIAPDYYFNSNCLTYIYGIDMLYSLQDPNKKHVLNNPQYLIGNTGWYNENFNGDVNAYTMAAPTYSIGGSPVSNPDPSLTTDFSIVITSGNTTFVNNSTKFVINHYILPETNSQFKNTASTFDTNFMFDRALQTVGSAFVNGDKNGGVQQVLTNIVGTFTDSGHITITGKINLSTAYKSRVSALTDKRFVLFVTIQDHTLATELSDKVALKYTGAEVYAQDFSNPDVGGNEIDFFIHPQRNDTDAIKIDQANPNSVVGWFVEDDVLSRSRFYVDKANDALIDSLSVVIKATHATYGSFELERQNFSFAGAVQVSGVQQININQTRGFDLKAANPFNLVTLNRKSSLDTGTNYYYELFYAFRLRWEYFLQLTGVNSQFFDPTQDFNGYNNNWNRFFAASGWSLEFTNELVITENDVANTITTTKAMSVYNYGDADDWSDTEVKLFENATNLDTTDYLNQTVTSRIEATLTYLGAVLPTIDEIDGELHIARYEQDGIQVIEEISTVWENDNNNILVSINSPNDNLLKKEFIAPDKFKFTCLIDHTKLDLAAGSYMISPRIYPVKPCTDGVYIGILSDFTSYAGAQNVELTLKLPVGKNLIIHWGDTDTDSMVGDGTNQVFSHQYLIDAETEIVICGDIDYLSEFFVADQEGVTVTYVEAERVGESVASIAEFYVQGDIFEYVNIPTNPVVNKLTFTGAVAGNSVLTVLDLSNTTTMTSNGRIDISTMFTLSSLILNPALQLSGLFLISDTALNQVFELGTDIKVTGVFNPILEFRNTAIANVMTQAVLDANIAKIYTNRASFNNASDKKAWFDGNNPAPGGTLVAPLGYIQADAVTVGNDGTPANAKEKIYVLVNQCNDNTVVKKYKWTFTVN